MNKLILLLFLSSSLLAKTNQTKLSTKLTKKFDKSEVIENPTLQTLSGSLNRFSLYSSFTYRGGALSDPLGAERPNILNAKEQPSLSNMSGNLGLKYRMTKTDNLSFQVGVYSVTPFHSSHTASSARIQREYDQNGQDVNFDDPTISYFKTYYLGKIQNISFVRFQYTTRDIYRQFGLRGILNYSHAAAFKLTKFAYIAASLNYDRLFYDQESTMFRGREVSLLPNQIENRLRGNLTAEMYLSRKISFRFITDIFSLTQLRRSSDIENRDLQQTIAMTYFINRDISIAPNIRFVTKDIRSDRTNIGLNLNVNL